MISKFQGSAAPITSGCPSKPFPLPSDATYLAEQTALGDYQEKGPVLMVSSRLAPLAGPRGKEVLARCGPTTFKRTVVVELLFPKMLPSASLSQGTVFISLSTSGYHIWEVAH